MEEHAVKILLVSSHPVQYAAPLYRLYSADPRLEVTVAYCSLQGAAPGIDPEFGVEVAWDIPLLNGYKWVHPDNISPWPGLGRFFGLVNPGLWTFIKRERFDVVVCYGYRTASFCIAAAAAKMSGAALVWTSDAPTLSRPGMTKWKLWMKRLVLRAMYVLGDGALAPSTAAQRVFEELGFPLDRLFLTPFAVEVDRFSRGSPTGLRRTLRISEYDLVVLFVGKLIKRKRPGDLIRAMSDLDRVHIWLAGEGPLRNELEAIAAVCAPTRVHFLGFRNQKELPSLYAEADCLAVPSDYDPFPVVVMEAMSTGLPAIVSSAVGSIDDLVKPGETGFVYPVGNAAALKEQLRVLASDRALLLRTGERARARMDEWGPKQNAEAFAQACLTIAERRS